MTLLRTFISEKINLVMAELGGKIQWGCMVEFALKRNNLEGDCARGLSVWV